MARGINKVILLGNVGNEPEIRNLPSGIMVATFSVATNESWIDKQTGNKQERTEWHRVVFFARLAEIIQQYVHKGTQVYVEGRLRTNKWQDQQGVQRYTTEILGSELQLLGRAGDVQPSYQPNYQTDANFPQSNNLASNYNNQAGAYNQNSGNNNFNQTRTQQTQITPDFDINDGGFDDYDDEIPF